MKTWHRDAIKILQNGALIAFVLFQVTEAFFALASYTQNENNGYFYVDFNNDQQGIMSDGAPFRSNIEVDTLLGIAKLVSGQTSGNFTTADIRPNSFTAWNQIILDANYSGINDIKINVRDCDQDISAPTQGTIISGFGNMTLAGGILDISGISAVSHPCINVEVLMTDGTVPPTIDSLRVTWNPLPGYLLTMSVPATVPAGAIIDANINYSVSYVDDVNTVVWTTLPTTGNSTITNFNPLYGQSPVLTFVSATNGGLYTATSAVINGVNVPANSIYWPLGNISAGQSGTLNFKLQTINGWQSGMRFDMDAHIDSVRGIQYNSDADIFTTGIQSFSTSITSIPNPQIEKSVTGTANINGQNYVTSAGGFSPLITYTVKMTNATASLGGETIFNPRIDDDISDILNKLNSVCSVAIPSSRITPLGGGTLSGSTITWDAISGDISHIAPKTSESVSYTVDYTGCPEDDDDIVMNNIASGFADNAPLVDDTLSVIMGIDTTPRGSFAKGDKVGGSVSISASTDDNQFASQTYGQSFAYELLTQNIGAVAIGDNVTTDRIPTGLTFQNASLAPNLNGTIFYNTSTSATVPAYTVVPGVGISGAGWSSTVPVPASDVGWIASYVPCLDSTLFPSPGSNTACFGLPASATTEVQVSIDIPSDICLDTEYLNTGNFFINSASTSISNTTLTPLGTAIFATDTEPTHATPLLPSFSQNSTISGPAGVGVTQNATYTITLANTGSDASASTVVNIPTPQIDVNGVPTYLSFVTASGGTIDTTGLPSQVSATFGPIPVGSTRTVTITYNIPSGVVNNDNFTLNISTVATDNNNCRTVTSSLSANTSVSSRPQLQTFKNAEESVVSGGQDIHYDITFRNTGNAPTVGTYVVDRIPAKSVFKEAYTSGTNSNLVAFNCPGCKVYFSNSASLPPFLSNIQPLDGSMISTYFTIGNEVTPGFWQPVGIQPEQVTWVAWLLDDTNMSNPLLPTGTIGKVGLTVTNDDDVSTLPIDISPIGTIISNAPAIFSTDLLQAIDNQVFTTILPDPGLRIDKTSDKELLYAGEGFNWNVDYYNDSGNDNTSVILTDTMPIGTSVVDIFHTWNAKAIANGAPSGEVNITTNPNVTITVNPDTTTTIVLDVTGLRGGNLENIEGGNLRIQTSTSNTLLTGEVLTNFVQGCFANPSGSFCISTTDDVAIANPDLWIRKQVDITDPLAGENLNYTLIVSNEGSHDAPNVLISDTLPAGLCYVGPMQVTTSGWSIGAPVITGGPCASSSTTLTWSIANTNNISNPAHTPLGTIQGNSEDIYIRYIVNVQSAVPPGTTLTNGAHIETNLTEDPIFPNDTSADVTTPLPDPYVVKTSQLVVQPGENSTFTITYGNNTRETAHDVYIVDTFPITAYPDYTGHSTPEMKFISVNGSNSEVFYFHDGPLSAVAPVFDPALPTSGGWNTTAGADTAFIAIVIGDLAGQTGPYQISVTFQAVDPNTNTNLSAGLSLTNKVEIFSSTIDSDILNNISTATTNTPGLDLAITKVGSVEGGFPGLAPGTDITYDITISNQGTVDACAVKVTDTVSVDGALSAGVNLVAPIHNFNTLALKDFNGNPVLPHNTSGNNISTPINITYNSVDNEWFLGSSSTTDYTNVCMPPGTHQTFQLFGQISTSANDSTTATNTVIISEDSPANEEIVSNNIDQSSVVVYKADLMIDKTGFSCGENWLCGDSDDTLNTANTGETIQYTLSYDNIGNIEAENPVITENIPAGTCFRGGSIVPPANSTLEYSLDNGASWIPDGMYFPGDPDCAVTNFRIVFSSPIPAPAHFDGEDTLAEFSGGTFNNTEALSNSIGDVVALKSNGLPTSYLQRGIPKKADINNDGKMDLVFSPASAGSGKTTVYLNQSIPSQVSFTMADQLTGPTNSPSQEHFKVSDLNNDNLPDITIIAGDLFVYRNTSVGNNISFVLDVNQSLFPTPSNLLTGVAMYYDKNINTDGSVVKDILDLNADNMQDIFVYGSVDSKACINTTPATPGAVITFNCPTGPGSDGGLGDDTGKTYYGAAVIDDFNNDGKLDQLTGGAMSPAGIKINRNTTPALSTIPTFVNDGGPIVIGSAYYKATAYDYDGDGWKDILISSPTRLLRNTTSSTGGVISFTPVSTGIINLVGGHHTVANLNGDVDGLNAQKMDIIVNADTSAQPYTGHHAFLNNSTVGAIDFATQTPITEPHGGTEPIVHDFNADGLFDILFAGFDYVSGSYIGHSKVFRNTSPNSSTLTFASDPDTDLMGPIAYGPMSGPPYFNGIEHQPQIKDFDKDGKDDILLTGGFFSAPAVFRNESTPSSLIFTPSSTTFSSQNSISTVALVENFDNDINDLPDVIIADDSSQSYAYTNISTPGNIEFERSASDYFTSGDYETLVSGVNVTSWDKLQVTQDLPAGTDIKYSFYSDAGCTAQLLPPTSAPNGYIDISGISGSFTQLCIKASFSTFNVSETPSLDAWRVTYRTFDTNSFTFQVVIQPNPTVTSINNTATISTTTPEITLVNNTDSYQISLNSADVQITKSVDKVAALSDDILTYTLNYQNNGPQEAKNVIIYDILPEPLVYTPPTSMVASNTSNGDSVSCIYDFTPNFIPAVVCSGSPLNLSPGESGTVTIVAQVVSSALLGDVLTNTAQITTDTLETDLTNNQDSVTTIINNLTNMYVDKNGPASTNINSDITYTINYGNNGNVDAKLTYFVDTLDPNTTFVSATQTSGSPALVCLNAPIPSQITCSSNGTQFGGVTIPAGATGSISVTVHVNNDPSLIVSNYIVHNIIDVFTISPEVTIVDNHDFFDVPILPVGASSLSGKVFSDADADVIQDILDTPISGVTIFLSGVDLYGNVFGPDKTLYPSEYNTLMAELVANSILSGGPYTSSDPYPSNYFPITPKITNVLGDYSFAGLSQGTYFLTQQDPSNYVSTGSNAGYMNTDAFGAPIYSPATDGHGSVETGSMTDADHITLIILGDGQNGRDYDFGETNGTIGDLVFMDTSGATGVFDGSDVGLGNVTINLYTDTNSNGVVDVGEPVRTTTTNSSGAYIFRNVALNQSYIVKVTDTNNVTSAFNAVLGTVGINNNGQNPTGYVINLSSANPSNTTADFGYSSPTPPGGTGGGSTSGCTVGCNPVTFDGVIGNQIFWDKNQDGVWGSGDQGLYQIAVTLFTDTNTNGVIDTGEPSATQLTNIDGEYWFSNLDQTKHYIVKVTDTATLSAFNFQPSIAPFPGQLDNYSKNPSGYLVSTFTSTIDPGTGLTFLANFTADFGYKTDEVLPETGQTRYIYGIVFGLAGVMLLVAGLRRYKII